MFKVDFQRKHIFIAFAVLIFLAVVYRFFPFFEEILSPGEKIELQEGRLIKYQKMIDSGRNIAKRLDALNKTTKQLESRLLTGKTPALAAVEIQKIMEEAVGKSNVQISSVKVLKPEELVQRAYSRIPVEFHILPTMKQLKEILYRLDSSQKYMSVKKIVVEKYSKRGRKLRCRITVAGFMKRAES